jgi:vancomycin resistance protein YoaR
MDAVVAAAVAQIESGTYSLIQAPVTPIEPAVKVEDLKRKTQLVQAGLPSYRKHSGAKMELERRQAFGHYKRADIGAGVEWSINKVAGPRRMPPAGRTRGLRNGGYVDEPGGGVCQISSTLYNAAIRSNIEVTDSTHHSISSNYIPFGLDATISTPSPDLKLKNKLRYADVLSCPTLTRRNKDRYGRNIRASPWSTGIRRSHSYVLVQGLGTFGEPKMNYIFNWK